MLRFLIILAVLLALSGGTSQLQKDTPEGTTVDARPLCINPPCWSN